MKKPVKIFFGIMCVVFVCVFAYSAYRLYSIMHEYHVDAEMNENVRSQYVSFAVPSDKLDKADLAPVEDSPITVDFDALKAQNADVVGWIYCEDTRINYPVLQGSDNDFYLHHFMDGNYSGSGTIFLDCLCQSDFSGRHSILYGHNMNDGSMFATIRNYRDPSFYEEHPIMYLNTPTQNYKIELFAGDVVSAFETDIYSIDFASDTDYLNLLEMLRTRSSFNSDVEVGVNDRIITLSTCTYEYDEARYVLHGKLVPIGQIAETQEPASVS